MIFSLRILPLAPILLASASSGPVGRARSLCAAAQVLPARDEAPEAGPIGDERGTGWVVTATDGFCSSIFWCRVLVWNVEPSSGQSVLFLLANNPLHRSPLKTRQPGDTNITRRPRGDSRWETRGDSWRLVETLSRTCGLVRGSSRVRSELSSRVSEAPPFWPGYF